MGKIELIPSPYQLANGKWVPRVIRRVRIHGKIHETKLEHWDETFEESSIAFQFVMAEIELMKIET